MPQVAGVRTAMLRTLLLLLLLHCAPCGCRALAVAAPCDAAQLKMLGRGAVLNCVANASFSAPNRSATCSGDLGRLCAARSSRAKPNVYLSLVYALGEAVFVIGAGFALCRTGFLPRDAAKGLGTLAGKMALPLLFMRAIATVDPSTVDLRLLGVLIGTKCAGALRPSAPPRARRTSSCAALATVLRAVCPTAQLSGSVV